MPVKLATVDLHGTELKKKTDLNAKNCFSKQSLKVNSCTKKEIKNLNPAMQKKHILHFGTYSITILFVSFSTNI